MFILFSDKISPQIHSHCINQSEKQDNEKEPWNKLMIWASGIESGSFGYPHGIFTGSKSGVISLAMGLSTLPSWFSCLSRKVGFALQTVLWNTVFIYIQLTPFPKNQVSQTK